VSEPSFKLSVYYPCIPPPTNLPATSSRPFDEEYFLLQIDCVSGDLYELTVCTDAYLARVRLDDRESGDRLRGQYLPLPDLVVANTDVTLIEQIVEDLIQTQRLQEAWRIPDEFTASWNEDGPIPADVDDPDDVWLGMPASMAEQVGWSCCHGRPAA
jgi:hypothetical protein